MRYSIGIGMIGAVMIGAASWYLWRSQGVQQNVQDMPQPALGIDQRLCDIRDYGAVEGTDDNVTIAINGAIVDCAAQGGGVVFVPPGMWYTGGIRLMSNIHLYLAEGATLSFSTDVRDYDPLVLTRFQGIELYNFAPLIYAVDSANIAITGSGTLIGNGDARTDWDAGGTFSAARKRAQELAFSGVPVEERRFGPVSGLRPSFIQCVHCTNMLIEGITIENGPFWTVHPVYVDEFTVRNVRIITWSGNTDGIALDSCRNVVIEDSFFATGDDAISIKSGMDTDGWRVNAPTEHVMIRNIVVESGSSGVSIGSEMSGGIRDVVVRDSYFSGARHGFRVKSTQSRGGFIEDVEVDRVVMDDIDGDAIDLNFTYSSALQDALKKKPRVRNIVIRNITGARGTRLGINIQTTANPDMDHVRVEHVHFTDFARGTDIDFARGVTLSNIAIDARNGPQFTCTHCRDSIVEQSVCPSDRDVPCVVVKGDKSQDIVIRNMDVHPSTQLVSFLKVCRVTRCVLSDDCVV